MSMTYVELIDRRSSLKQKKAQEESDHKQRLKSIESDIEICEKAIGAIEIGIDPNFHQLASEILNISEAKKLTPEVASQYKRAIEDARSGFHGLSKEYFGVKEYAGWASQAEDHPYGMGPRHGHIWFRIGLTEAGRKMYRDNELTADHRIAAAHVLTKKLEQLQKDWRRG